MRNKIWLPIFLGMAVVFGLMIGMFLNFPTGQFAVQENRNEKEQKLREIIKYIDFEYVDKVNTDSLLDLTITDLLRRLDPHSTYIPQEEVARSDESIKGSFNGIGIEFKIFRDTLTIVNIIPGGPSSKKGLKAGQRIIAADGVPLFGKHINNTIITENLKGSSGSSVELEIYDPYTRDTLTQKVRRGAVPLKSISADFMVDEHTAFVKLDRFSETTAREIRTSFRYLVEQGARNIILDLRDNPGGLLTAARAVADEFLEDGELIVFTKDRQQRKNEIYASGKGLFEKGKVVILINEGSASASEIVAGAIQDNDRGTIVGRKSFGKGLVQEEIILEDGSKMRLTTQHYYTPTGRSIQKPYNDYHEGYMDSRGYREQLPVQDSALVSPREFTTPGGKTVYGGGGILPDVLVPYDTSRQATVLYHLNMLVNMDEKAFRYVDKHRQELQQYKRQQFVEEYELSDEVLLEILSGSPAIAEALNTEMSDIIKRRLKAYLAYNLYGQEAFMQIYLSQDPIAARALELLRGEEAPQPVAADN